MRAEQCASGEIMSIHHGEIIFNEPNVYCSGNSQQAKLMLAKVSLIVTLANTFASNIRYVTSVRYQDVQFHMLVTNCGCTRILHVLTLTLR